MAAGARDHRAELSDLSSAQQRVKPADHPHREKQPAVRQLLRDFARSAKDAGADRVADGDGYSKADTEHAQQRDAAPQDVVRRMCQI